MQHRFCRARGSGLDALMQDYEVATHEFELAGGYELDHRIERVLLGDLGCHLTP